MVTEATTVEKEATMVEIETTVATETTTETETAIETVATETTETDFEGHSAAAVDDDLKHSFTHMQHLYYHLFLSSTTN